MKRNSPIPAFFVVALSLVTISLTANLGQAQEIAPDRIVRPRTVASLPQSQQTTKPPAPDQKQPKSSPTGPQGTAQGTEQTPSEGTEQKGPQLEPKVAQSASPYLSPAVIQSRISEAERLLKSRPLVTAKSSPSTEFVTLAALDRTTSRIHLVSLSKETFLTKGAGITLTSSLGTLLDIRVLRA